MLLDSSTETLRSGFEQMEMLRTALRTAEGQAIALVHHLPCDPTPARAGSPTRGKRPVSNDSCPNGTNRRRAPGGFVTSTVDGLLHVVDGNSAKAPAEVGSHRPDGVGTELRPHGNALGLRAPARRGGIACGDGETGVEVGAGAVSAMSVVWEGSRGAHVVAEPGIRPWHVTRLEPANGVLTGIRPGQAKFSVTVDGVTSSADVRVESP